MALEPTLDGELLALIVDYKVKSTLHSQAKADHDPQAGLYLAGRWLAGDPAHAFCFAQIGKPDTKRKTMSIALVTTQRSIAQLRTTLARIAQAASQIAALYHRYGPDEPYRPSPTTSNVKRGGIEHVVSVLACRGAEHHQILDSFEGVRAAESTRAAQLAAITGEVAESQNDAGYAGTAARPRVAASVFAA